VLASVDRMRWRHPDSGRMFYSTYDLRICEALGYKLRNVEPVQRSLPDAGLERLDAWQK